MSLRKGSVVSVHENEREPGHRDVSVFVVVETNEGCIWAKPDPVAHPDNKEVAHYCKGCYDVIAE